MIKQEVKVAISYLLLRIISVLLVSGDPVVSINLCDIAEVDYENYTEPDTQMCGCKKKEFCIRKCCQMGFQLFHDENPHTGSDVSVCIKTNNSSNFTVPVFDITGNLYMEDDNFMIGMLHCENKGLQYFKILNSDPRQKFYVQKNGSLYYHFYHLIYSNDRYCVDEQDGLTAYLCFLPRKTTAARANADDEIIIHLLGKLTPLPFLLATFIVYAILPESSLHGRALVWHVFSLIVGNGCLAGVIYHDVRNDYVCQILGYSIIFFMIASFFWMNVMCIDIWLTFSGLQEHLKLDKCLFLFCSFYAWGMPLSLVIFIFLMNTYGNAESIFHPQMGSKSCFVNGNVQILLYYFGPILVLVVINAVLFILTAINIQKVRKATTILKRSESRRHSSREDDRKKFRLYWKLLFAMGINPVINIHVFQTISWSVGWKLDDEKAKYMYYFKDLAHTLYGIFIFITYVCKSKIWKNDLKKRYYMIIGKPFPINSMPQTALTNISTNEEIVGYVTNNSADEKEEAL